METPETFNIIYVRNKTGECHPLVSDGSAIDLDRVVEVDLKLYKAVGGNNNFTKYELKESAKNG